MPGSDALPDSGPSGPLSIGNRHGKRDDRSPCGMAVGARSSPGRRGPMNDSHSREILTRSLDILQNVRQRPEMYLRQVTPEGVEAWLAGFQVGLFTAGVRSSAYGLRDACERRGIPFTTTAWLVVSFFSL